MTNGWEQSADAWIALMGARGDFGREHVLDPVMLERVRAAPYVRALDVGCGEGRFCRMLQGLGIATVGLDSTERLIAEARRRDPNGDYRVALAERLPHEDESFDLVVSYLTLIDIDDFRAALQEMVRVLKPGGTLLIANLNSFFTSDAQGWVKDGDGRHLYVPVDRYSEEFPRWAEWSGVRIRNWHRPLAAYMQELLSHGLTLTFFDEPLPRSGDPARRALYCRAPWFIVMEWRRAA